MYPKKLGNSCKGSSAFSSVLGKGFSTQFSPTSPWSQELAASSGLRCLVKGMGKSKTEPGQREYQRTLILYQYIARLRKGEIKCLDIWLHFQKHIKVKAHK